MGSKIGDHRSRKQPGRYWLECHTHLDIIADDGSGTAAAAPHQKKAKSGIKTPKPNVDLIERRVNAVFARYGERS